MTMILHPPPVEMMAAKARKMMRKMRMPKLSRLSTTRSISNTFRIKICHYLTSTISLEEIPMNQMNKRITSMKKSKKKTKKAV